MPATGSSALANALYVGSFLLALFFAFAWAPLVRFISWRLRMLDEPGGRRVHPGPIPRPGGLTVFLAFGLAIAVFWSVDQVLGQPFAIPEEVRSPRFRLVVLAAALSVVVGFVDDLLELRARWQLAGQLVIAAIVIYAGIRVEFLTNPLDPQAPILLGALAVPFTVFWIAGMINAINFIDGLDGLAAGVCALAAFFLGLIALTAPIDEPFVAWIAFTLAGALAGFLFHNFHPAKLFLGTTGVTFLGTVLAVLAIFGTAKVAAALLILGVPIIDTFYVIVRRLATGRPPFAPDRGHFHHRLLDIGLSHSAAVLLIYAITAVLGVAALFTTGQTQVLTFIALSVAFGVAVVALAQQSAKAREFESDLYEQASAIDGSSLTPARERSSEERSDYPDGPAEKEAGRSGEAFPPARPSAGEDPRPLSERDAGERGGSGGAVDGGA